MRSVTLSGAQVKIRINGKFYGQAQSIQYTIDTADQETYGVDSIFPQEISPTRSTVSGSVSGISVSDVSLQALGIRDPNLQILGSGYAKIEIIYRRTGKPIVTFENCRITNEQFSISTKGTGKLSFAFRAVLANFGLGNGG